MEPNEKGNMKMRLINYGVAAGALAGVLSLVLLSMPAAQSGAPVANPEARPTPRTADGHPDLNGYWAGRVSGRSRRSNEEILTRTEDGSILFAYGGSEGGGFGQSSEPPLHPNQPSYKPEYMEKVKAIAATMYGGTTALDPYMDCKPLGVPRATLERPIMQIAQTDQFVMIAHEAAPGPVYRVVYTDGRPHPEDYDTSYFGHSIGHWEGDTLVVDTVGLNDETWLSDTRGGRKFTTIHSDQMQVIERWTRQGDVLLYEATVNDPVMFTKPWVIYPQRIRLGTPDDYVQPQMCVAHDKNHIVQPTQEDQFKCNWCIPASAYGLPERPDK